MKELSLSENLKVVVNVGDLYLIDWVMGAIIMIFAIASFVYVIRRLQGYEPKLKAIVFELITAVAFLGFEVFYALTRTWYIAHIPMQLNIYSFSLVFGICAVATWYYTSALDSMLTEDTQTE